jgi:hypothetical protein
MQLRSNLNPSELRFLAHRAGILEILAEEIARRAVARDLTHRAMEHSVTKATEPGNFTPTRPLKRTMEDERWPLDSKKAG